MKQFNLVEDLKPNFIGNIFDAYEFLLHQRWNSPHWWNFNYDCSGLLLVEVNEGFAVKLFSDWYAADNYRNLLCYLCNDEWVEEFVECLDRGQALNFLQERIDEEIEVQESESTTLTEDAIL